MQNAMLHHQTRSHPLITGIAALILSPLLLAGLAVYVIVFTVAVILQGVYFLAVRLGTRRRS